MSDTERISFAANHVPTDRASDRGWPRWQVAVVRGWAALLALYAVVMAQGVVMIGSAGPHEDFIYATSTIWKLLSLGAVVVVMWTGGRSVAAYWAIAAGQIVWVIAGVLVPQPDGNGVALTLVNVAIFYGPLIAFRPHRSDLLRPGFRPHWLLLTVAVTCSLPLVDFAIRLSGQLSGERGLDMVGLYLILAGLLILAALRPGGATWLFPIVALGTALTGLAGILLPHDLASPGMARGLAMLAIGLGCTGLSLRSQWPIVALISRTHR